MKNKVTDTLFTGIPQETLIFLNDLSANNTREWFNEHRREYEEYFLKPAFAFTNAMGKELNRYLKGITYEARVDRSIFRINRDTRFSKDKAPYKTHMGIVFWKGPFINRHNNPGFYFHIESQKIFLATGAWMVQPEMLAEFRASLLDDKLGTQFEKIIKGLESDGIRLSTEYVLKKCPKGFDPNHKLAEYFKYKELYVDMHEVGIPDIVHTAQLIDYCGAFYSKTATLASWMSDVAQRTFEKSTND